MIQKDSAIYIENSSFFDMEMLSMTSLNKISFGS